MNEEKATCRGCGKELIGKPYYMGGHAYERKNGVLEPVPFSFYGGFVCSRRCDEAVAMSVETSMPGHFGQKQPSQASMKYIRKNWDK